MATQAVVSVVAGGKTILKIVTGSNGKTAAKVAVALKHWCAGRGIPAEEEALELAQDAGFDTGSLVVVSETMILSVVDGNVSDEPNYARYRTTFPIAWDNPRWDHVIADHCFILDLASGKVMRYFYDLTELEKEGTYSEIFDDLAGINS